MKTATSATIALAVILTALTLPATADQARIGDRTNPSTNHLVRLRVDPTSSVIQVLPGRSRDVINSSFTMVSASCPSCGTGCPPIARSVEIELRATADVAAGYGVSDLRSINFTPFDVSYSTRDALTTGETVIVTLTGDVLDCEPGSMSSSRCAIRHKQVLRTRAPRRSEGRVGQIFRRSPSR